MLNFGFLIFKRVFLKTTFLGVFFISPPHFLSNSLETFKQSSLHYLPRLLLIRILKNLFKGELFPFFDILTRGITGPKQKQLYFFSEACIKNLINSKWREDIFLLCGRFRELLTQRQKSFSDWKLCNIIQDGRRCHDNSMIFFFIKKKFLLPLI